MECHCSMDPNITKTTTGKERVVSECVESLLTSGDPNRTRFLTVQVAIHDKMQCDRKTSFVLGSKQVLQYVHHMRLWITESIVTDNIVYVVSF